MAKKASKKKATAKKTETKTVSRTQSIIDKRREAIQSVDRPEDVFDKLSPEAKATVKNVEDVEQDSIFTGICDFDLNAAFTVGKKAQLIGPPNFGKSLVSYLVGGAAQQTCRVCYTPIITFINDWEVYQKDPKDWEKRLETMDFERKTTCRCGENDPMNVLLIDTEKAFNRNWTSIWGLMSDNLFRIDEQGTGTSADAPSFNFESELEHTLFLCEPENSDQFESLILPVLESGAIDFVIWDSIAALAMSEDLEGYSKIGSLARFLRRILTLMQSKILKAHREYGTRTTLIATNHLMSGPVANPRMNPNTAKGGWAWKFFQDNNLEFTSSKINTSLTDGYKERTVMRDLSFHIPKAKQDVGNQRGSFRLFMDDYQKSESVHYYAGETNEPEMLLQYIKEVSQLDPELYSVAMRGKTKAGYEVAGRVFKRVKDIVSFLKRRDVQFMMRPILYSRLCSLSRRLSIDPEDYMYNPFNDRLLEMIDGRKKALGDDLRKVRVVDWNRAREAGDDPSATYTQE